MQEPMEPFFNADFFRSLITTFLGAVLAILVAVLGWWLSGRERRKSASLRRSQLAQALGESLEFNLEIAKSASEISDQDVLTVNIELSLLETTCQGQARAEAEGQHYCWEATGPAENPPRLKIAVCTGPPD